MYSKAIFYIFFSLAFVFSANAQDCIFSVSGTVEDPDSEFALIGAEIRIESIDLISVSDVNGNFAFSNLCKGSYVIKVSYVGFQPLEQEITIVSDSIIVLELLPSEVSLPEASVMEKKKDFTNEEVETISTLDQKTSASLDLASRLQNSAGVNVLRTGATSSKPIIHGAYGNRLTLMNHGLAQAGQQWGLDHSPEIDPVSGGGITVVKGVSALQYPGNSLGGIVIIKDAEIQVDSSLHTELKSFYESNGKTYGTGLVLSRGTDIFKWRAQFNYSKSGDKHTPDYLLRNTGSERLNGALQSEIKWAPKWSSSAYLSTFNSSIGILRGAHVGNLTDLENAINSAVPLFTTDTFSYDLESPYQKVNHQLARVKTKFKLNQNQELEAVYGFQFNRRKEFDIRRGERSEIPAMSIEQFSNYLELKHSVTLKKGITLLSGVQLNRVDNTNVPETGILPLIPDYVSREVGIYSLLRKTWNKNQISAGVRLDIEDRNVATISSDLPRRIIRYNDVYQNVSASAGWKRAISENWSLNYNFGLASRNPEVNELYSSGLHQGVSGIEEGDVSLKTEQSVKQTFSISGNVKKRFSLHLLGYYQHLSDYIFLNPTNDVRLTIRGAFPVFEYAQADASIYGADVKMNYDFSEKLSTAWTFSYLVGENLEQNLPLVFMPSNSLSGVITYDKELRGKWKTFKSSLNGRFTFEQNRLEPEQDFLEVPEKYALLGAVISVERSVGSSSLQIYVKSSNLLNTKYRDYLNRQRYFSDDLGRNIVLGINLDF